MTKQPRRGPVPGKRQAGKEQPNYDPSTGKPFRLNVTFAPEDAQLLIGAANQANLSLSGLVNELVRNMPLDPVTGKPLLIDSLERFQEAS